jgi:hypothetical protein
MFIIRKKSIFQKMENHANRFIVQNFKTFAKFNTESIIIDNKDNKLSVVNVSENGVEKEIITPVIVEGYFRGDGKVDKINRIIICINTAYNIAKVSGESPMTVLNNALVDLKNKLEAGVYVSCSEAIEYDLLALVY